jgi:hypothetical protein
MPLDLSGTLRQALGKLKAEKSRTRIDRQIAGLTQALNARAGSADGTRQRDSNETQGNVGCRSEGCERPDESVLGEAQDHRYLSSDPVRGTRRPRVGP